MTSVPPLVIPISALLPPGRYAPPDPFPSPSFALLGPLPPTTPLHLALNYLAHSELPEYVIHTTHAPTGEEATGNHQKSPTRPADRVVIITGDRNAWKEDIEDEDEDWMRDHGGDYGVVDKLKRVDIRSCPSPDHLKLLLNLLSSGDKSDTIRLETPPGLVVLWDVARVFMDQMEEDENLPPPNGGERPKGGWKFRARVNFSDYMDLISAARATARHLTALRQGQGEAACQLVILEPRLDRLSSLPILRPAAELVNGMTTPTREKRVNIRKGLEWLLGDVVGLVELQEEEAEGILYTLTLPTYPDESFHLRKRPCPHAEYANARAREVEGEELGSQSHGYRWEWTL